MIYIILFVLAYYGICYYAEKAYDAMCIDLLSFIAKTGNEKDQKRLSKMLGVKK